MTDSPLEDRPFDFLSALPPESGTILRRGHGADYRIDESGCWIWLRGVDHQGYGRLYHHYGHFDPGAHREYYRRAYGQIPAGWHVHHRCHVRLCVNPEHLEAKAHEDHLADHKQAASSLTWDDVRAIREAVKAGVRQQELRLRYGIAQPTLSDIVTNTTWKDASYQPGRPATCDECGEDFLAGKANQRFCCPTHRKRFINRECYRRRIAA